MHVQKYLHDMAAWNALSTEEQERVIGRTKLDDIELDDDVKPANSHVALNVIEDDDGNELKILRHNMPFGEIGKGEFGTYFIGYSRTAAVTEQMLRNMFIGDPPGNTDRILDFSTAVTGSLFFTPIRDFLDDPPPLPSRPQQAAADPQLPPRLAGHRQPERTTRNEQPVPRTGADHRRGVGRDRAGGHANLQAAHRRSPGRRRQRTRRSGDGRGEHRSPDRRVRARRRA